jgi:hypothetical protein
VKFYSDMSDDELQAVDLAKFTGLKIGDVVTHANAGQSAGSDGIISGQKGTIIGHHNQGLYSWHGLCVTVTVRWDNGKEYEIDHKLARKVG